MKVCSKCKEEKPFDAFARNRTKPDGYQNQCRACKSVTQRNWYLTHMEEHKKKCAVVRKAHRIKVRQFLWDYLLEHPCVDCGESDPVVLEFDHVRGTKDSILSKMLHYSLTRVKEEILKCEVRCANCHRRKTQRDQAWYESINTGP